MALRLRNLVGPEIADLAAYLPSVPLGYGTTTTPSPPQGTRWLQCLVTNAAGVGLTPSLVISDTHNWITIHAFRLNSVSIGAGVSVGILEWAAPAGGVQTLELLTGGTLGETYVLRLKNTSGTVVGTGTLTHSAGVNHAIRISFTGAHVVVESNGIPDLVVTSTTKPTDTTLTLPATGGGVSVERLWRGIAEWGGDSPLDKPEPEIEVFGHHPVGDVTSASWGSHTSCADASGTYAHWDDWNSAGTNDGATTYNCRAGGSTVREISEMSGATYTKTIRAVKFYPLMKTDVVGKAVFPNYIVRDGTNETSFPAPAGVAMTTFTQLHAAVILSAPGGTWTQTVIDNLEAGLERLFTATPQLHCTALSLEGAAATVLGRNRVQLI